MTRLSWAPFILGTGIAIVTPQGALAQAQPRRARK